MPEINKEFHSYEHSLLVKHNKRRISRPSFIEYQEQMNVSELKKQEQEVNNAYSQSKPFKNSNRQIDELIRLRKYTKTTLEEQYYN